MLRSPVWEPFPWVSRTRWAQQNWNSLGGSGSCEWGKMSSSSVSVGSSAGSFGGSSSVLEWSSVEENELVVPVGFSLLVYAWKR